MDGESVDFGLKKQVIETPMPHPVASGVVVMGATTKFGADQEQQQIAVYDIIGPVVKYGGACSYGATDHAQAIAYMAANPNVGAIILNIDSPGGQVAGTTLLADVIKDAANKKPVIAMINDGTVASAAYWIASACTEIYCTKKSDGVGSIGVFTQLADMSGMYEQKGIKIREIYATKSAKDKNGIVREALKGNDEPLIAELDQTVDDFVETVRANRGDRLKGEGWDTGKMYRAKEAARMGLIDGIKSFEHIIKRTQQLISNNNSMNNNINNRNATDNTGTTPVGAGAPGEQLVEETTPFANIMRVGGIDPTLGITVFDEGFALEEKAMNQLDSYLANHEQIILDQQATIDQLNTRIQALEASDQQATIDQLNARIAELEGAPDGDFAQTTKPVDATGGGNKYLTSFDLEKQKIQKLREGK